MQAFIEEKLVLAAGGQLLEAPFSADLGLYHPRLTSTEQGPNTSGSAGAMWRFQIDPDSGGPVVLLDRGTPAATLRWADEELVATVNVLSALVTTPTSLAHLLEP